MTRKSTRPAAVMTALVERSALARRWREALTPPVTRARTAPTPPDSNVDVLEPLRRVAS